MRRKGTYSSREIDDNSSQKVFQLRKEKQLGDAYELAIKLYNEEPNDEWIQKAYAWVLIDIIKIEINNNDINIAQSFFNQLQAINFHEIDEIMNNQINFIKPKLNISYQEIQQAENLSKNGNHQASIELFSHQNNSFSENVQGDFHPIKTCPFRAHTNGSNCGSCLTQSNLFRYI